MKGILCTLSSLIIIGWGIGYFEYRIGGFFHLILVIALAVMVIQLIPSRKL